MSLRKKRYLEADQRMERRPAFPYTVSCETKKSLPEHSLLALFLH